MVSHCLLGRYLCSVEMFINILLTVTLNNTIIIVESELKVRV